MSISYYPLSANLFSASDTVHQLLRLCPRNDHKSVHQLLVAISATLTQTVCTYQLYYQLPVNHVHQPCVLSNFYYQFSVFIGALKKLSKAVCKQCFSSVIKLYRISYLKRLGSFTYFLLHQNSKSPLGHTWSL
jgi:hypothetical protein